MLRPDTLDARGADIRHVTRLAGDFLVSGSRIITAAIDSDLVTGVTFLDIVRANVRHLLEEPDLAAVYFEPGDLAPEALRRPVSIYAIARELRLPYETARRHIGKLLAKGLCVRGEDGGVVAPAAINDREDVRAAVRTNFEATLRFVQALADAGVTPRPMSSEVPHRPEFLPREVVRLSSGYFLNAIDLLIGNLDLQLAEGLMFLAVVRANAAQAAGDMQLVDAPRGPRRAVSINGLARDLNLPYETARRHAHRLIEAGILRRSPEQGLVASPEVYARDDFKRWEAQTFDLTGRFVNDLAEVGLVMAPSRV